MLSHAHCWSKLKRKIPHLKIVLSFVWEKTKKKQLCIIGDKHKFLWSFCHLEKDAKIIEETISLKNFIYFFITSQPILILTNILTLKPASNLTLTQILTHSLILVLQKANKKCVGECSSFSFYSFHLKNFWSNSYSQGYSKKIAKSFGSDFFTGNSFLIFN